MPTTCRDDVTERMSGNSLFSDVLPARAQFASRKIKADPTPTIVLTSAKILQLARSPATRLLGNASNASGNFHFDIAEVRTASSTSSSLTGFKRLLTPADSHGIIRLSLNHLNRSEKRHPLKGRVRDARALGYRHIRILQQRWWAVKVLRDSHWRFE